jgi:hypothetical protein
MNSDLLTLAQYLSGEFVNQEQAIADPAWYVSLRLWQRPLKVFPADQSGESITIFAEQANVLQLASPYRQRLLQVMRSPANPSALQVQYYGFLNPAAVKGAGQNPSLLATLTPDQVEFLPGCVLEVTPRSHPTGTHFVATAPTDACCRFHYEGKIGQVSLGFEISPDAYLTYDKGIDPETGRALWGAIMGPYRYQKIQEFVV